MAPHPVRDVDMERKEELILAKQLRAARVTILSRQPSNISSTQTEQPVRKKALNTSPTPKPNPKSIARAQNPVALRYWNICRSQAQQPELHIPESSQSVISGGQEDGQVPWALPDTSVPGPSVSPEKRGSFAIKVPNINRQIKDNLKTDWTSILAEDEAHQNKLRAARVSAHHSMRQSNQDPPPPKFAWMKSHANKQFGGFEGRNMSVKPGDLEMKQDMKAIFSKLAPEVKTELIFHHLSSQQSEVLSKYLKNIPQPVLIEALVKLLPTFSQASVSSICACLQDCLLHEKICTFCGNRRDPQLAERCEEPSLTENKECDAAEISGGAERSEEESVRSDEDDLEDKSSVESTLESQISDTIHWTDNEKIEETQTETQINEKLANDDDLCKHDRTVDNDEELGLNNNENNLQTAKYEENIGENYVLQSGCENSEEKQSEVKSQEEYKDDSGHTDDRNKTSVNPGENNEGGNNSDENNCEHLTDPGEEDSWEYEWEDEEDNEFEFFEVDEDEYKVQTFDGSFSIAI